MTSEPTPEEVDTAIGILISALYNDNLWICGERIKNIFKNALRILEEVWVQNLLGNSEPPEYAKLYISLRAEDILKWLK